ncbi:hypothetical protein CGGC5_v015444 [Colletotrichum fructicola Nara gc5]|uniref:Uncharacterized protein n=1 Tax=Colletotrichum fructicola (strain Nara gc5) TaxID=1213859 RepID=A0A7J6IJK7_COLFN|nr:hypothetical protein CGGC5_v015444 [Colletotrichum fructicola Nara gc5]
MLKRKSSINSRQTPSTSPFPLSARSKRDFIAITTKSVNRTTWELRHGSTTLSQPLNSNKKLSRSNSA